ncbi:transposase [Streptosporangium amethystogenes subsp. fukuiense]|uniref:transposase n=1 Tax=Streptosporangium amethystogenes TaxID=2002 RepID=UPI00361D92AA
MIPSDFPPWATIYGHFARWARQGVVSQIRDQLRRAIRLCKGRCPSAVTLIVDSQSVKGSETVSKATRGFDPAKRINGRKRHLVVDPDGLQRYLARNPGCSRPGGIASRSWGCERPVVGPGAPGFRCIS